MTKIIMIIAIVAIIAIGGAALKSGQGMVENHAAHQAEMLDEIFDY